AVAVPPEDPYIKQAQDFARTFMTPDLRNDWTPGNDIAVVRVLGTPNPREGSTSTYVDVTLQQIGQLASSGAVNQVTVPAPAPVSVQFEVVTNPDRGGGWRIKSISSQQDKNIGNRMLLSSDALDPESPNPLFTPQLIYYWPSSGRDSLVPDLRYLPTANISIQ